MKGLANKLFESREVAHMLHLSSEKYAKHIALQEYYDGILDLIDDLVESYQGQFELIGNYMSIDADKVDTSDVIKYIQSVVEYIKKERSIQLKEEDTHLQSIVDDIVCLLYKTIYKLKYLQ